MALNHSSPSLLLLLATLAPLATACKDDPKITDSCDCLDDTTDATETGDSADSTETGDTGDSLTDTEDTAKDGFETIRAAIERDLRSNRASGASVAIWKDGGIYFAEGFGSRHPDREEPVATTTLFQIGSDTKKLTAILALRQVEAGSIALDSTLEELLPDLAFSNDATWSQQITLQHLLTHSTGLWDYTPWSHDPEDTSMAGVAYGRFAENEYAMAPSGEFWNYSNPNFSLVGLVTEEVDGRFWGDMVEDDIFAPLGMSRSFARLIDVAADGDFATGFGVYFADGYDTFDVFEEDVDYTMGTIEMENQADNAFTRPAGLVWSTASDMVRLAAFLMDGDPSVLSDDLRENLWAPWVPLYPQAPAMGTYGMGLMSVGGISLPDGYHEMPIWTHGGNTMSMTSAFYVFPEQGVAVSILSNGYTDDFSRSLVAISEAILELPEPVAAPEWPPATDIGQYAGTYDDPWAIGPVELNWDGKDLTISAPEMEERGYPVDPVVEVPVEDMLVLSVTGGEIMLTAIDGTDGTINQFLRERAYVEQRVMTPAAPKRPASRHGEGMIQRFHPLDAPNLMGTPLSVPLPKP